MLLDASIAFGQVKDLDVEILPDDWGRIDVFIDPKGRLPVIIETNRRRFLSRSVSSFGMATEH